MDERVHENEERGMTRLGSFTLWIVAFGLMALVGAVFTV